MPNWVYNKVHFHGDANKINRLKKRVTSEDSEFDFEKIIPMPKELNMDAGSTETISMACARARKEGKTTCEEFEKPWGSSHTFDEWADIGDKYISNLEKYGATTWYGWSWDHWGTKWNACDVYWVDDDYVEFNTAWNTPEPVFAKLAEMFPDIQFNIEFADENIGSNCGTITYDENGFSVNYLDDYEFACEVWGYDPEELEEEE